MTRSENQKAILNLSEKEQWELEEWFREFMADQWDREIERDASSANWIRSK